MLVLTRRPGETIVAGNVKFTINWIEGNQVSVGIEAPREVTILREELLLKQQPPTQADSPSRFPPHPDCLKRQDIPLITAIRPGITGQSSSAAVVTS